MECNGPFIEYIMVEPMVFNYRGNFQPCLILGSDTWNTIKSIIC